MRCVIKTRKHNSTATTVPSIRLSYCYCPLEFGMIKYRTANLRRINCFNLTLKRNHALKFFAPLDIPESK